MKSRVPGSTLVPRPQRRAAVRTRHHDAVRSSVRVDLRPEFLTDLRDRHVLTIERHRLASGLRRLIDLRGQYLTSRQQGQR